MKSKWYLALVAVFGLAMFSSLAVPVAAATPTVRLVLGGSGATPWAIGAIAPGDTGTKAVTLSNTGFSDGVVTIWISDIVNSEGDNPQSETGNMAEPGELGNYLILNVSGDNLSADFILPARIHELPQGEGDTKHIYLNPLKAFSTLALQWEWRLPPETGDDIQGDVLSFTINYMLEELPGQAALPPSPQGGGVPAGPVAIASVGITITGPPGVLTGSTGTYTLTVPNTGTVRLNEVVITYYLPALVGYQSSIPPGTVTGSQITWNLGTLNAGETKEITIILDGLTAGIAGDTATVTTREGVTATDSLDVTVLGAPGVHLSLNDSSDPVAVGDEFTYTIDLINQSGSNSVHNFTIVGLVPGQMAFISAAGPTQFTVTGKEIRFGPVAELKPGESVQYQIRVKAITAGAAAFNASMRSDGFGEPLVSQEGTTVFILEPPNTGSVASLPPAQIPPQADSLPAPSGIQEARSVWWLFIIPAVIGEAALGYFVFFIMKRRRQYQTTRHQRRVAELASAIAREMNLSGKLVRMLLMFGLIRRPGPAELPHPAAQTALQYHETLNGSGYPLKRAGDDILLEARILAVADTVETMSAPRPHHPAIGMDKALEEIRKYSSTLFDSEVVKALERLLDRGNFRFRTQYT